MKKVLLGMSGGVDSSVAALLLKNDGYEVIGVTMVLFKDDNIKEGCLSSSASIDAKKIADKIGIEHHTIDLTNEFKKRVIDNFIDSYKNGLTPNPCVECNRYIKFGTLWEKAKEFGCDYIATGHYAKVIDGKLCMAEASSKDQSYFLSCIDKEVLNHIIFPLENYHNKDEIRKIASDNDLFVATKKDSQEICFIPNDDYTNYLNKNISKVTSGNFMLTTGEVIGKHKGIIYYTVGQRKGLGISYKTPLYVVDINKDTNIVTLGSKEDLFRTKLIATRFNKLVDDMPFECDAKIRFRITPSKCKLTFIDDDNVEVEFEKPVRAITKGQTIVFYDNNVCLGGAIIKEVK